MSFFLDNILSQKNQSIEKKSNKIFFDSQLKLTKHHYKNCKKYIVNQSYNIIILNELSKLYKHIYMLYKVYTLS